MRQTESASETVVVFLFQEDVTITDIINGSSAAAAAAMSAGGGDASSACGSTGTASSERGIDVGRVGSWATDFEKLLRDPLGLQTFTVRMRTVHLMSTAAKARSTFLCLSVIRP